MLGFSNFETVMKAIYEIEVMYIILKRQIEGVHGLSSDIQFLNKIMGIAS